MQFSFFVEKLKESSKFEEGEGDIGQGDSAAEFLQCDAELSFGNESIDSSNC